MHAHTEVNDKFISMQHTETLYSVTLMNLVQILFTFVLRTVTE